ncbi:hypothetical protein [Pararhizobium sp.]|uniref:hypothetical protein n=1 Tax=Pararhizobium sp. TaxID=1977563 RepID=UPI003D0DDFC9
MPDKLPSPAIDLERFAFYLAARIDASGLSYQQIQEHTGVRKALISRARNGQAINAAATYVLAETFEISMDEMLQHEVAAQLTRIRAANRAEREAEEKAKQNQAVPLPVTRETLRRVAS